MHSIDTIIDKMYQKKANRGWDTLYWLVDVHDTIIKSTYSVDVDVDVEFTDTYPYCFAALRFLSERKDCKLILWTSSRKKYAKTFMKTLKEYSIDFSYFNRNPECKNTKTGDFSKKFYFNVILDDKAGFDPEVDWKKIYNKMKEMPDD